MPPAAATATRVLRRSSLSRKILLTFDAIAAPSCTTGPSVPSDAPVPIESVVASGRHSAMRPATRPPRFETASITLGMPEPLESGESRTTIGVTKSPPRKGMSTVASGPPTAPKLTRA